MVMIDMFKSVHGAITALGYIAKVSTKSTDMRLTRDSEAKLRVIRYQMSLSVSKRERCSEAPNLTLFDTFDLI
jgi:hypothetical protein